MRLRLPKLLVDYFINRSFKTPYSHLKGYMNRWWLVPYTYISEDANEARGCGPVAFLKRPIAWLFQRLGIAIRVHEILISDPGHDFHDHPWPYMTIILKGGYVEVTPEWNKSNLYHGEHLEGFKAGRVLLRKAQSWHRLILINNQPCWTLFITGPKVQSWGFLTTAKFKTYYKDYLKGKVRPNEPERL